MGSEWERVSVAKLQEEGVILVEDGNHGNNRPRPDEFCDEGVKFIRAADMDGGRVLFSSAQCINDDGRARVRKGIGEPGDVLLSHKGTVGKVAAVPMDAPEFVCSPQTTFYRTLDEDKLDRVFLFQFLKSYEFQTELMSYAGETDMAGYASLTNQRRLHIALPPIEEQRAIAEVLGSLDDKIELNRRMSRTLESMARAWFKSWFVDFDPVHANAAGGGGGGPSLPPALAAKFPATFISSPLGDIPEGWEVGTIGDAFKLTMGQSPPGSTYNEEGDGIPFYQGRRDFGFRFPTRRVYCNAPTRFADEHDVLVSVRAPVGDVNVANERCCIGRGVAAVRSKVGASSYALHAMLALGECFARFDNEGTVFGSINKKDFANMPHILPPQEVIDAFEASAAPLDARVATNKAESRTLTALRDAMLPKLLGGELGV